MIIRKPIIVLSSLFFSFSAGAQTPIYKVSGNGLKSPSYVYGTMHIMCERDFTNGDFLVQTLAKTKRLILEMDITDQSMMSGMQTLAIDPSIKDLYDRNLSQEVKDAINDHLSNRYGLEFNQVAIFKPIFLLSLLLPTLYPCEEIMSYEQFLADEAVQRSMPITGLETAKEQMKIFDAIPILEQIDAIKELMVDVEKSKSQTSEMSILYKEGHFKELQQMMNDDPTMLAYSDDLLNNRNIAWADMLPAMMRKEACFIGVGAGHLSGDQGLIELLRKKGFKVETVPHPVEAK